MNRFACLSLISVVVAAGRGSADPGSCSCPIPPVTLFHQPQPPPPQQGPVVPSGAPVFYRAEMAPAQWTQAPCGQPVTLYQLPAPVIQTYCVTPPAIPLCRAEVQPPRWTEAPPRQGVTLYQRTTCATGEAPPTIRPPVTFVNRGQPNGPISLGTPSGSCPTCAANAGSSLNLGQ